MHIILDEADPGDQKIECRHCRWQGPISDVRKDDYLLLNNITEFFCPSCRGYLGFIQHSSPGENQADV